MHDESIVIRRLELHGHGFLRAVINSEGGVAEYEYYSSLHLALRAALMACAKSRDVVVTYEDYAPQEPRELSMAELLELYFETEEAADA